MAGATQPGTARQRRAARGRELLADTGGPWSALPVEWPREAKDAELPGWSWRVRRTLAALLARPRRSFAYVQEPVDHSAVLRLLLTVRLLPWAALLVVLGARALHGGGEDSFVARPIDALLDPRLADVVSLWLLLMAPAGVPLLYFFLGIATHMSLVLTGGAPRSIAATMRAVGYALAPALLGVALLDVPLHLGALPGAAYLASLAALSLLVFVLAGAALTATHQLGLPRGYVVALVPAVHFAAYQAARAVLVLRDVPGWEPAGDLPYLMP
jgi:hypothetical protein